MWAYLEGRLKPGDLRQAALAATRQLAKRQLTWLRSFGEVRLGPADEILDSLAAAIEQAAR